MSYFFFTFKIIHIFVPVVFILILFSHKHVDKFAGKHCEVKKLCDLLPPIINNTKKSDSSARIEKLVTTREPLK